MIKIAFFVEGQTESIFIEKFLYECFKTKYINIIKPVNISELYREIKAVKKENDRYIEYYFLIYDVGANNDTVVSKICEVGRKLLEIAGYQKIFGLCDLYEKNRKREDKRRIIDNMNKVIKKSDVSLDKTSVILAIMEIEAWFLADHNLFSKIDSKLTPEYIKQKLNIDLIETDPEEIYNKPSKIISKICYELLAPEHILHNYKKREKQSYKIADSIDYEYLYLDTKDKKISAFHLLVDKFRRRINTSC